MIARFATPFFLFMGLLVVPVLMAVLCRWLLPHRWWRKVSFACSMIVWAMVGYGVWVGYEQLQTRHVVFASADVPVSFDGYRIVHFSDAHVGTMTGSRKWLLQRAVDSINAQHPDLIVFTGDLQNILPQEIEEHISVLGQLQARDGVISVLGNHDYAVYQDCDDSEKQRNCRLTIDAERRAGWQLLLNEHRWLHRDTDSICIAGMENWGIAERMPRRGDVAKTLAGLHTSASSTPFIIMLQHDPTCWREHILPECCAQLTLSGHTHGGQISLFGLSPVSLAYNEWGGMYREGSRALYVSTGLGGLIPFRIGLPGEIVLITLKKEKQ